MRKIVVIAVALAAIAGTGLFYRIISKQPPHPRIASEIHQDFNGACTIEGTVINADGEVISGATVFAELNGAGSLNIPTTVSDKDGKFKIPFKEMGNYTVYGSKEEDGYPLSVSGFHQQVSLDQIPKLTIASCTNVNNVVLQLGQKAAMIEGDVRDHVTHQYLERATITLRRAENPELLYRTSTDATNAGKFRVLVPTEPFTIEVDSPKYETWTYTNDGADRPLSLTVARGQTKKLQITLRPKK